MEKNDFNLNSGEQTGAEKTPGQFSFSEQEKNIGEVFKLSPELAQIGTIEQYETYLRNIFPESKIKGIVWHYSDAEFKNENFKPIKPNFDTLNSIEGVYNFSTNQSFVKRYGQRPYAVILNIYNPLESSRSGEYVDDLDRPLSEALYKIGKQKQKNILAPSYDDNLKDTDAFINNITGEEYIERHPISGKEFGLPKQTLVSVFDPSQIHILGSKADIEKFKEFVSNLNGKK